MNNQKRRISEKFKKTEIKTKLIIALVIIALIGGYIFINKNKKGDVDTVFLTQILTKSSELTTAKLKVTGLSEYHDEGIKILNKSDFTMCYTTSIRAGVNLTDVKVEQDKAQKKIYITIPKAEVFEAKVDPNDIKFYGTGFALLNVNEKEDVTKALALAEKDAMEYAKETGILEVADQQSETLIKGILANAIPNEYTIEVKNWTVKYKGGIIYGK